MKPCTIINTGKHYSFYVKREVEGNGCEKSFSWNGARWVCLNYYNITNPLAKTDIDTYKYPTNDGLHMMFDNRNVITHRIPNRRDNDR